MTEEGAALLLDLDGTLADSLAVMRGVYDDFLSHFGKVPTEREFQSLNGPPLPLVIETLKRTHGLTPGLDVLAEVYLSKVDHAYESVMPMPGAADLIGTARRHGWKVAVVTSNAEVRTLRWLDRTGILPLTDLVVAAEQSGRGKPYPDPYLTALNGLGVAPNGAIAVEDSPAGARAAAAAGVRVMICGAAEQGNWPEGAMLFIDLKAIRERLFDVG